jgi:ATP-binding cassette subfamily C protein/ATP-binding cassette subfamily C protein LapB
MSSVTLSQTAPEDLKLYWRAALENRYGCAVESEAHLCALLNFLNAYGWQGSARKLLEALPANDAPLDFDWLRAVLAHLQIRTIPTKFSLKKVPDHLFPVILKPGNNAAPVVVTQRIDRRQCRCASTDAVGTYQTRRTSMSGVVYVTSPLENSAPQGASGARDWFKQYLSDARSSIVALFLLAFVINFLSLVSPLAIMVIYDQVIGKNSLETLEWLVIGIAGLTVFEVILKICRARFQAHLGAKMDYRIATRVFEQVLHLPPLFTERAPVAGQISRLREFDAFREIFSSPLASSLIDLPFTVLFLLILFLIGGPIIAVPLALAFLYLLIARFALPIMRSRSQASGRARSDRYGFLVELINGMRAIKQQQGKQIWLDRFRNLSADSAWATYSLGKVQAVTIGLSQTIMMTSGAMTLGFGVFQVINGALSMGALIAIMLLVWRVLGPMHTLLSISQKWEQARQSYQQLIDLLSFKREQEPGGAPDVPIHFHGRLSFNRVSMRYGPDYNPSLLGVDFTVRAGEMIGIAGDSGSGKSTLAKLAMGLYQPQAGSVTLDGIDLRQLRPITLRQTIGYVAQRNALFPGSIRDNIMLADPTASDAQVRQACKMAGILHKVEALPDGIDTVFREGPQEHPPQGFLRQIALARAFLKEPPVFIFDEPTSSMDSEDERFFLRALEVLRGRSTIIMITQRPSQMRLCDRLLYLELGQVRFFDVPERVIASVADIRGATEASTPNRPPDAALTTEKT